MDGKIIYNKLEYLFNYNLPIKNYNPDYVLVEDLLNLKEHLLDIEKLLKYLELEVLKGGLLTNKGLRNYLLNNHNKEYIELLKFKKIQKWLNQKY